MSIQHAALTGNQLHEPKGVSAASAKEFNLASSNASNWTNLHYRETVTASSSASVSFDDLDGCRELVITFEDLLASAGVASSLTVSTDNGSSYLSTSIYYSAFNRDGTSASSSTHSSLYIIDGTSNYLNGQIRVSNFNKGLVSSVKGQIVASTSAGMAGSTNTSNVIGSINFASAFDAIRFLPNSGNYTSGKVHIEGLKG